MDEMTVYKGKKTQYLLSG